MLSTIRPPCDILCHHPLHTCKRLFSRDARHATRTRKSGGAVFFFVCIAAKINTKTHARTNACTHENTRKTHDSSSNALVWSFWAAVQPNQWGKLVSQPNPPPFAVSGSSLATTLSEPDTHTNNKSDKRFSCTAFVTARCFHRLHQELNNR